MSEHIRLLSVVVSVFNEETVLGSFYEKFMEVSIDFAWDYELIFVNDGSTDASRKMLEDIAEKDNHVKLISFSRNFGHEAAMLAGIDYAAGDAIVCMDADLQHPPECIHKIINKLEEGYEVISMIRLSNRSAGKIKNITSAAFYKFINALSNHWSFEENASDFFAISWRVAEVIRHNFRGKKRFLRGYIQNIGFKKTTLGYNAADRIGGESHYSIHKLIRFSIDTLISFSDFPLKCGIGAGACTLLLAVICIICGRVCESGFWNEFGFLTAIISIFFGILFLLTGVIGYYLAAVYAELKDTPLYIIDDMINFFDCQIEDV